MGTTRLVSIATRVMALGYMVASIAVMCFGPIDKAIACGVISIAFSCVALTEASE